MLAYLRTEKHRLPTHEKPDFAEELRRRRIAAKAQSKRPSYDIQNDGVKNPAPDDEDNMTINHFLIKDVSNPNVNKKPLSISVNDIISLGFALDSDGVSVEIVVNDTNGGTLSMLLYMPNELLTPDAVQDIYSAVYYARITREQNTGYDCDYDEVLKPNQFVQVDDDDTDNSPDYSMPSQQQSSSAQNDMQSNQNYSVSSQPQPKHMNGYAGTSNDAILNSLLGTGNLVSQAPQQNSYMMNGANTMNYMDNSNQQMQMTSSNGYSMPANSYYNPQMATSNTGYGSNAGQYGNGEFDDIKAMMDNLLQKMSTSSASSQQTVDSLRAQLTSQYVKTENLTQKLTQAQQEKSALNDQIAMLNGTIADKDRTIKNLNQTIANGDNEKENLQTALSNAQSELAQTKSEAQNAIKMTKTAMDTAESKLKSAQSKISVLNSTISQKESEAQDAADKIADLQNKLRDEKAHSSKLSEDLVAANDSIDAEKEKVKQQYEDKLNAALKDASDVRQQLVDDKNHATKTIHELSTQTMQKIKEQQDSFNADRSQMQQQIDSLSKLIDTITSDRDSLSGQIAVISKNMNNQKQQLSELNAAHKDLQSDYDNAQSRLKAATERNDSLSKQVKELQKSVDVARENAARNTQYAANKYAEAIKQRDACENTLNALRSALLQTEATPDIFSLLDQAIAELANTKTTDNTMLLTAADNTVDTENIHGVYIPEDHISTMADDIVSQYLDDSDTKDDADNADAEDGTDKDNTPAEGTADADADTESDVLDDDYDYSFGDQLVSDDSDADAQSDGELDDYNPSDDKTVMIDDDTLAGTPLSDTGSLDSEQVKQLEDAEDSNAQ